MIKASTCAKTEDRKSAPQREGAGPDAGGHCSKWIELAAELGKRIPHASTLQRLKVGLQPVGGGRREEVRPCTLGPNDSEKCEIKRKRLKWRGDWV